MRCPKCDQWNRAAQPHCIYCGTPLEAPAKPSWRDVLKDEPAKEYIRVDEDGDAIIAPDDREVLAAEMAELKARKDAGIALQQQMQLDAEARQSAAAHVHAPSQGGVAKDPFFGLAEDASPARPPQAEPAMPQEPSGAQGSTPYRRSRDPRGTRVVLTPPQWEDSRSYDPVVSDMMAQNAYPPPPDTTPQRRYRSRRASRHRIIRGITLVLVAGVLGLVGYFGYSVYAQLQAAEEEKNRPLITASMVDDQAAHTILIPGSDGETVFISNDEVTDSYPVVGGFATITIPDYVWYENDAVVTEDVRTVTLVPYRRTTSGRQKPMDPISYEISIPLSPITVLAPTQSRTNISTAMYSIILQVRPGSQVVIVRPSDSGGVTSLDVSDTVNENGLLTYNASIQPIGDNVFDIHVRSPYCRENTTSVVLHRNYQEIPIDLEATTYTRTTQRILPVSCKTLKGAQITVLSNHSDLKITDLDTDGEFTFNAIFDHYGLNTISISASYPGKADSQLDYEIYYVPSADVYTPKAWPLNSPSDYSELMGNLSLRASESRIYVAVGEIAKFENEESAVQLAVMYCSEDGASMPVLLENQSRTTWKVGETYTVYGDVYGNYNNMPWLIVRYTY